MAEAGRRRAVGKIVGGDHPHGAGDEGRQAARISEGERRHHGPGKGDRLPDRRAAVPQDACGIGQAGQILGACVAAELSLQGEEAAGQARPLRARPADEAGGQDDPPAEDDLGPGGAGHPAQGPPIAGPNRRRAAPRARGDGRALAGSDADQQEQALQRACSRGGVYLQGQSAQALRVRLQDERGDHQQEQLDRRHSGPPRQSLRWAHARGRNPASGANNRPLAPGRDGGPRLSRPRLRRLVDRARGTHDSQTSDAGHAPNVETSCGH